MSERDFFHDDAKRRVRDAIKEVESKTSAELVVSVHHRSAQYRHADYLVGFVLSIGALCVLLWAPIDFALWSFPIDVAVVFAAGALLSSQIAPLRRALTPAKARDGAVHDAACAAFLKLGISRTTGRNGILVFVSTYERRAEVLADAGIDAKALGAPWEAAIAALDAAAARLDFEAFIAALLALGPLLGGPMPHREDDVNELSDEVDAA